MTIFTKFVRKIKLVHRTFSVLPISYSLSYKCFYLSFVCARCDLINTAFNYYYFIVYKTIILPVVLYGCETLTLILREEHRLRVFENRVLRRIFGPRRNEVMGDWRKLHNEELHNLYSSPNIIRMIKSRRMRWAGHVARMRRRVYIGY
jgi:hypothetical protein